MRTPRTAGVASTRNVSAGRWRWLMRMGSTTAILQLVAVLLAASPASGKWVVNDQDECVRVWSPSSALRGPVTLLKAPLTPLRWGAGGVQMIRSCDDCGLGKTVAGGLVYGVLGVVLGGVLAPVQAAVGIADTVTAGYFEIAPDEWSKPTIAPVEYLAVVDTARTMGREDDCGRPTRRP